MITIIVLHKANRKVTGNYLGIIAALISLMSYMFFTINSFNSDSIITPDWPSIFLFISWPIHLLSLIIIFKNYSKNKKNLKRKVIEEERERQKQIYLDNLIVCRDLLLEKHKQGYHISVDTNALLYNFVFTIIKDLVEKHKVPLYISMVLFNEIDNKKTDKVLGYQAREVIRFIERQQKLQDKNVNEEGMISFMKGDIKNIIQNNGMSFNNEDDKILAFTLFEQQQKNKKMLYISNDRGTRIKAVPLGIETFDFNDHINSECL